MLTFEPGLTSILSRSTSNRLGCRKQAEHLLILLCGRVFVIDLCSIPDRVELFVKRNLLILAVVLTLIAPLAARPTSNAANFRAHGRGAAPARTVNAKPASDIASRILAG